MQTKIRNKIKNNTKKKLKHKEKYKNWIGHNNNNIKENKRFKDNKKEQWNQEIFFLRRFFKCISPCQYSPEKMSTNSTLDIKEEKLQLKQRNTKDHNRPLWTIMR